MKKLAKSVFMAVCMMLIFLPITAQAAGQPTSGTCGDGVTWNYEPELNSYGQDEGGTLIISGTGEMIDYQNPGTAPWNNLFFKIKDIKIELGITRIGNHAFQSCTQLENISLPDTLTSIGDYAFWYCTSLNTIELPNSLLTIGDSAFGYTALTEIVIPASVIRINTILNAFGSANNLVKISVDSNNTKYSSIDGILLNKDCSEIILCPRGKTSCVIPSSVTSIGDNAFSQCSKLTAIEIPNGVTSIGIAAFSGCTNLANVIIPDSVINIAGAFMPEQGVFANCTSLTHVSIPNGMQELTGTFYGCLNLTSVSLPVSLTAINSNTFAHCVKLETINYAGTETQWGTIRIAENNQELGQANIICAGSGTPIVPDEPNTPSAPGTLSLTTTNGGLGKKVTVTVTGGHWLTVQVRRAGSVALSSLQAPGSGTVSVTFSAAAGSTIQVWETAEEMSFTNGIPDNQILNTATKEL